MAVFDANRFNEEADFLFTVFSQLKPFANKENVKYLLGLYYIQKKIIDEGNEDDWEGATIPQIVEEIGEKYIRSTHHNVPGRFYRQIGNRWLWKSAMAHHFFKLKKDAFDAIKNLLSRKADVFAFFQTPIPLEDFQGILERLDSLYYVIKAVTLIDECEEINLYKLSQLLSLSPIEFINLTHQYAEISNNDLATNSKDKYLFIKPGLPKYESFERFCDEYLICNTLCKRCHNTNVALTIIGSNLANNLRFKPIFISKEPYLRKINNFFRIILMTSVFWYLLSYYLDQQWFYNSIPFFIFFLFLLFVIKWFFVYPLTSLDKNKLE